MIPRVAETLFEIIDGFDGEREIRVYASYLQIYREIVQDLVGPDPNVDLKLRRDPKAGAYVQGLSEHLLEDAAALADIIDLGNTRRAVASTLMNSASSRSHAIVIIRVEQEYEVRVRVRVRPRFEGEVEGEG